MPALFHIAYVSFSDKKFTEKELEHLLFEIRSKNKEQNITGLLLYNNESFIQVVEGEKQILLKVFEQIKEDGRHHNIVKLIEEPIEKRSFPDWSMGFEMVDYKKTKNIPGFSNFMTTDNPARLIKNASREVMKLLNSFIRYT